MARVESARGAMCYYVVSDGSEKAYRLRVRTGSFMAMGIIEEMSQGLMIADLIALIASLDVVAPEIDR
jgi:NADH-quinone oxidoreductase subunit D